MSRAMTNADMTALHSELIADYTAAFRACNTMNEPPEITFSKGWYTFKSPRTPARKYRGHAVARMRDTLKARALPDKRTEGEK